MVYAPLMILAMAAAAFAQNSYYIGTSTTKDWITGKYGVHPGAQVRSTKGNGDAPPNDSLRCVVQPSLTSNTISTISDGHGLYMGIQGNPQYDKRLTWGPQAFHWHIVRTAIGSYNIFIPGENYYIFDNSSIPTVFELSPDNDATGGDLYFNFVPA